MLRQSPQASRHVEQRQRGRVAAVFLLLLIAAIAITARAAEPTPKATEKPAAAPEDAFDRGVPRSALKGFFDACGDGDYERAAQYLDLSHINAKERPQLGRVLARHLKVVLDHTLLIDPDTLSDDPEGEHDDGLSANRDRVGTIHETTGATVDVLLERVKREDGVPIWKISAATVAKIPALYQQFGYGPLADLLPAPLFDVTFLNVELWQWIGLAVLIVISGATAWLLSALIARLIRPVVARFREQLEDKLDQLVIGPLRLGIGVTIFYTGVAALGLSLHARAAFNDGAMMVVIGALAWLSLRLIDIGTIKIEDRLRARGQYAALAMLPLGRRTAKVFLIAIALLALLENIGFNVTGLLAGLGVGGLAVALAAQETVKNFFGGIALITDQPVRVGDFCRFGDKMGIVEDISIWSTRVRTLDRTVVSIPNGQFVGMQLENFTRRDRTWLHTMIGLQYDTSADQLRAALDGIRTLLTTHPKLQHDDARARFVAFGPSLQIEISAYVLTSELSEFSAIREDILLAIVEIVARSGAHLIAP